MSNKLKNIYTNAFDNIIKKHTRDKANTIFVLAGITPYIYVENFNDNITDQATFDKEGNLDFVHPGMVWKCVPEAHGCNYLPNPVTPAVCKH